MADDNDQNSSAQSTKTKLDESKPADASTVTQSTAVKSQAERQLNKYSFPTISCDDTDDDKHWSFTTACA